MSNIILKQGDCLELMKELPDESVSLILTDIPYGEVNRDSNGLRNLNKKDADTFNMNINQICSEFIRITSGSIYIFCGTEQVSEIRKNLVKEGLSTRLIIWEKTNPSPMNGETIWLSGIECCVYGKKKGGTFNGFCNNTVLRYSTQHSKLHPTQKPIKLFEELIKKSSNESDTILDPFMGSGTTGVACVQLNRNFIGYEISPDYFKIAEKRISEAQAQQKLGD